MNHLSTAVSRLTARRNCLMAVLVALPGAATAFDLSLPKFEDLREKWASVGLGLSPELVQR